MVELGVKLCQISFSAFMSKGGLQIAYLPINSPSPFFSPSFYHQARATRSLSKVGSWAKGVAKGGINCMTEGVMKRSELTLASLPDLLPLTSTASTCLRMEL
jgi:hypothetical protein